MQDPDVNLQEVLRYQTQARQYRQAAELAYGKQRFNEAVDEYLQAIAVLENARETLARFQKKQRESIQNNYSVLQDAIVISVDNIETLRNKAEKLGARSFATSQWNAAEQYRARARKKQQESEYLWDKGLQQQALDRLQVANAEYQKGIAHYERVIEHAIEQKRLVRNKRKKPVTTARMKALERAIESQNLANLKKLVSLSTRQEAFFRWLFANHQKIDISLKTLTLSPRLNRIEMSIDYLLVENQEAAIPGKRWKISRLESRKSHNKWSKFEWNLEF